jgi:nicotinate-nucleotide pyrophosphorylase (carboxylating)
MKTFPFLRKFVIELHPQLERIIRLALEEDLGSGDFTTDAIVQPQAEGKASLIAREEIVLAGLHIFKRVFLRLGPDLQFEDYYTDGDLIPEGKRVCLIRGLLSHILKEERPALNFLQRMSGVATLTRAYVVKTNPSKVKVLDTRKTTPGLRPLDKYAVGIGGGFNHRRGLFDGILIKDNHIAIAGSIARAVELVKKKAPHTLRIEVEVESLEGVQEALDSGVDVILLDNMTVEQIREAVRLANGRVVLEASGGIGLDSIEAIAETGVNFISVGALTHSAKAADLSLEIIPEK